MGGTPKRMENFAHFIMDEIGYKLPAGTQLQDISAFSYRYSMYKVGCLIESQSIDSRNNFSMENPKLLTCLNIETFP